MKLERTKFPYRMPEEEYKNVGSISNDAGQDLEKVNELIKSGKIQELEEFINIKHD